MEGPDNQAHGTRDRWVPVDALLEFLEGVEQLARRLRERLTGTPASGVPDPGPPLALPVDPPMALAAGTEPVPAGAESPSQEGGIIDIFDHLGGARPDPVAKPAEPRPSGSGPGVGPLPDGRGSAGWKATAAVLPPRRAADSLAWVFSGRDDLARWSQALDLRAPSGNLGEEAEALKGLLQNPPGELSPALRADLARWFQAHADVIRGLEVVGADDLGPDELPRVPLVLEPGGKEAPGFRIEGRLAVPPLLSFPDSPGARLARLCWQDSGVYLTQADKLALARGQEQDQILEGLLKWAEAQPPGAGADLQTLLGRLGVQWVDTPTGPDDSRFEVAQRLYRQFDKVLLVLRPAVVRHGTLCRPGRMQVATSVKPPPLLFLEDEKAALLEEMRLSGRSYKKASFPQIVPITADQLADHLETYLKRHRDARAAGQTKNLAVSFANFVQEVLNLLPEVEGEPLRRWQEHQDKFKRAALVLLRDLGMFEEPVMEGEPYDRYKHSCLGIPVRPRQPANKPGTIASLLAPALKYRDDGSLTRGTLLYYQF